MNADLVGMLAGIAARCTRSETRPEWLLKHHSKYGPPLESALYYRFLHRLAAVLKPNLTVEIGTSFAVATGSLADGFPEGRVITIDQGHSSKGFVGELHTKNVEFVQGSSILVSEKVEAGRQIDLLFIDGQHTFFYAYKEYELYRRRMPTGALILIDDIWIDGEMGAMWNSIVEPKVELNGLHYSGFGVVQVDRDVKVPAFGTCPH